ncbi:hypothetical protein PIB30_094818, partial [Stylosanthes scabra]|nr:hypothetical protein [Stylosanthes scabra]
GRGGIEPVPLEIGEALVVGGCRPSHALVGHGTQPMHECRGGGIGCGGVTRGKATALVRGVTPGVPAALVEEGVPWVSLAALVHGFAYK